jgi:hypothetical protein
MSVESPLPHPVPVALRAIENGQGLKGLHVANPFTGEYAVMNSVTGYNGENLIQIDAPNGTSYWTETGEHVCGYYPEGSNIPENATDWQKQQNNAFFNTIWSGIR